MADLKLTLDTHDLDLTNLQVSLTDDTDGETLAQRLKLNLLTNTGEWIFNQSDSFGVPYLRSSIDQTQIFILTDGVKDIGIIDGILREKILSVPGVKQLVSFTSSVDKTTRTYSFDFSVVDDKGDYVNLSIGL
jgi:hypothetical protein